MYVCLAKSLKSIQANTTNMDTKILKCYLLYIKLTETKYYL